MCVCASVHVTQSPGCRLDPSSSWLFIWRFYLKNFPLKRFSFFFSIKPDSLSVCLSVSVSLSLYIYIFKQVLLKTILHCLSIIFSGLLVIFLVLGSRY